jgi:uncharacterized protein YjbI with pentapeptide repeats
VHEVGAFEMRSPECSEKLNVPLAGPVSFVGFIIIGPAVLVLLRAYLEIYIEHGKRLARVARFASAKRDPTLLSSQNAFLRVAFTLILDLLLPLTLFMFAWKAAVFPHWGASLLCVAIAAIVVHLAIPLRVSWRSKMAVGVGAALVSAGVMVGVGAPRRHFDLFRADLAHQWLFGRDLKDADLSGAHLQGASLDNAHLDRATLWGASLQGAGLSRAHLGGASLSGADLEHADLHGAYLHRADLSGAYLKDAFLSGAHLEHADLSNAHLAGAYLRAAHFDGADLSNAHLDGANLSEAEGLTPAQIDAAYGDAKTQLPEGLARPKAWTAPAP